MSDELTPTFFEQCQGVSTDTPTGELMMRRFVADFRCGRIDPATMAYVANAFQKILADLESLEGTGATNRDRIFNAHIPVTQKKKGRSGPSRRDRQRGFSMAFRVEQLVRMQGLSRNKAIERVSEDQCASRSTVERSCRRHRQHAAELFDMAQGKGRR